MRLLFRLLVLSSLTAFSFPTYSILLSGNPVCPGAEHTCEIDIVNPNIDQVVSAGQPFVLDINLTNMRRIELFSNDGADFEAIGLDLRLDPLQASTDLNWDFAFTDETGVVINPPGTFDWSSFGIGDVILVRFTGFVFIDNALPITFHDVQIELTTSEDVLLEEVTQVEFINFGSASNVVPIPPALYLFGSGILGLIGISRRKKSA